MQLLQCEWTVAFQTAHYIETSVTLHLDDIINLLICNLELSENYTDFNLDLQLCFILFIYCFLLVGRKGVVWG